MFYAYSGQYICTLYIQYNSTIYQNELFIDKHEGITCNKVYAQAKITSYEDGWLQKRSHSKIIQQQCNPQSNGKPKNNQQHNATSQHLQ